MSTVKISGNASGTGTFEIAAPNSNTNRTQTLPDATGTVVLDSATQTLTNKTLTTPNIDSAQFATVSGTAPIYPCRAWVNFDGTNAFTPNPSTTAIRASGNVSSITDNGTGDYTINFTTAMPDANYGVFGCCTQLGTGTSFNRSVGVYSTTLSGGPSSLTTSNVRIFTQRSSGTAEDYGYVAVSIFR